MTPIETYKVVMLPTEKSNKEGDIVLNSAEELGSNQVRLAQLNCLTYNSDQPCINQHLYIISDDEIKEGNWYIIEHKIFKATQNGGYEGGSCKKIVATTDRNINEPKTKEKDITYSMLPEFHESFIQAFIKSYNEGKPITEVDLEMECGQCKEWGYVEECRDSCNQKFLTIKTRPDNTVIVHLKQKVDKGNNLF